VQGQARVEWLRSGTRYQVHMDLSVGPSFAPLMSRRVSSEGEITALGLWPRRYDEVTRVALRQPRPLTIFLDADQVRLPAGAQVPRPDGVQDSASQFVQLTWLFTMQPNCCRPVAGVELPLALPRVETWSYEVLDTEQLDTPAGPVAAVHVKPRRRPRAGPRSGGRVLGRAQPAVPAGAHPHPPGRRNLCRPGHRPVAQTGRGGALTQLSALEPRRKRFGAWRQTAQIADGLRGREAR
jgi:hypothetical protein